MQKIAIGLSLASLLGVAAFALTHKNTSSRGALGSREQTWLTSPGKGFKNAPSKEETALINAAFVPSTKAMENTRQLFNEGKLSEAEAECRRSIAVAPLMNGKPFDATALPLLGDILLAQGHNQDALECYLRVKTSSIPDDPEKPRPNLNVALAYCRLGNFKMAKKYCPDAAISKLAARKYWADWPGTGDIRALEASLLFARAKDEASMGHDKEALAYLEPAAKLAPKNWLIDRCIGDELYNLNRRDEAVSYYKIAVKYGGDKVSAEARERAGMTK